MPVSAFKIDLSKEFPHLAKAPIVEAVMHWQCKITSQLKPEELQSALQVDLPDYPDPKQMREFGWEIQADPASLTQPAVSQRIGWVGLRLESEDKKYVAQVRSDGLVVSRLEPYEDWDRFTNESLRLWEVFVRFCKPSEVQRLGVRFINSFKEATPLTLDYYLREPPICPANLPLSVFYYKSTFDIPDHPLSVHVVKTMQAKRPGLVLDIDVFTREPIPCEDAGASGRLEQMRFLKNEIFTELLNPQVIESLKRE